ncbi:S41 family peptidase [Maridesulfovibrio sp. FT414]|uniref:S41 family peptidase n=1 Tax=Maridesulfovibrio sp. FT414 TaxID=2979469 RepID=UPI003D805796
MAIFNKLQVSYYSAEYSSVNIVNHAVKDALEVLEGDKISFKDGSGQLVLESKDGRRLELDVEETSKASKISDYLGSVILFLEHEYPDKGPEFIFKIVVDGAMNELDPHSEYLDKNENSNRNNNIKGKYAGVGMEVTKRGSKIKVVAPFEGGPAKSAGIKSGDMILSVDGESVRGMSIADAVSKIRGLAGSTVVIAVRSAEDGKDREFSIVRKPLTAKPVHVTELASGYVHARISWFNDDTAKLLSSLLSESDTSKGIILDLRDNPGGRVSAAVEVADLFLPSGRVVQIKGRNKADRRDLISKSSFSDYDCPVVVLINASSASSSEIVAGALQDRERALVLGIPSFGKGTIQTVYPLTRGDALKLTRYMFFLPSGRQVQTIGIIPDVYVRTPGKDIPDSVEREKDLANAFDSGKPYVTAQRPCIYVGSTSDKDEMLEVALQVLMNAGEGGVSGLKRVAESLAAVKTAQ